MLDIIEVVLSQLLLVVWRVYGNVVGGVRMGRGGGEIIIIERR